MRGFFEFSTSKHRWKFAISLKRLLCEKIERFFLLPIKQHQIELLRLRRTGDIGKNHFIDIFLHVKFCRKMNFSNISSSSQSRELNLFLFGWCLKILSICLQNSSHGGRLNEIWIFSNILDVKNPKYERMPPRNFHHFIDHLSLYFMEFSQNIWL